MNESNILKTITLALGRFPFLKLFRNNTAQGWVGKVTHRTSTHITLEDYRPLHAGLVVGSSDLIGWKETTITPDMVGKKVAIFTAIECKGPRGRTSPEQANFVRAVLNAGGIAGIARSPDDARFIIGNL